MKRDWYPSNGRNLMLQRKRGEVPKGYVNVVLDVADQAVGYLGPVLTLRADEPTERMDWRMLVNLDVWVWADDTQPINRLIAVVRDIVAMKPKTLTVRFLDPTGEVHDVDCGSATHMAGAPAHGIPDEHTFVFHPLNLADSRLGRELCRVLSRINLDG